MLARRALAWVYALGAVGYLIYGLITSTGLIGWLDYAQQRAFGSYRQKLSLLVALVLVALPTALLRGRGGQSDPAGPVALERRANAPLTARGLRVLFGVLMVLLWSVGFGVHTWMNARDQRDYEAHYEPLRLDGDAPLPAAVEHVALYGKALERARLSFGDVSGSATADKYYLIPVVPEAWRPDQPVRCIVKSKTPSLTEPTYFVGPVLPDLSGSPPPEPAPVPVLARVGGSLSVSAAQTFQQMGLILVEPQLLERIDAINGKPIAPDTEHTRLLFFVMCSLGSAMLVVFYFAALAGQRRRAGSAVRAAPV
jgi:hypothetical protein